MCLEDEGQLIMTNPDISQNGQTGWHAGQSTTMTAQYDRLLQSPRGGTYCFSLKAEDCATVLVNGDMVIDMTDGTQTGEQSRHVALAPGNHHIQLRYHERNGEARLRLRVGQTLARNTLPDSRAMPHTHLMEIQQTGSKATVV